MPKMSVVSASEPDTAGSPASGRPGTGPRAEAGLNYFPPLAAFLQRLGLSQIEEVNAVSRDRLVSLFQLMLEALPFNQEAYLERYPDVAKAVALGVYSSARHHFQTAGYFEGREPWPAQVDEAYYLQTYPDVAAEIRALRIQSAQEHFELHGRREGRIPSKV
jgi:hypothetical protein